MKDLRDTFASQLLTSGVPLGYISHQLGHADIGRRLQALRALVRRV
jgi:integrase